MAGFCDLEQPQNSVNGSASIRAHEPRLVNAALTGPTTSRLFKLGLALLSFLLIATGAWWTWQDFEEARHAAEARLSSAAQVTKGHAVRSLSAIDSVLASAAELAEREGLAALHSEAQWLRLRQIAQRLPETGEIFVVDEAGNGVAASTHYPVRAANASDREWFQKLKAETETVHIGRALKGRGVHNLFFPVARALHRADGSFSGAVQVGVDVGYLADLLRDLELGPGAAVGVYRASDGALIARHPMTEAMLTAPTPAFFSAIGNAASWVGWMTIDGEPRLAFARREQESPIIACASVPRREVYAAALGRLPWRAVELGALWAALAALTALAVRQSRREAGFRESLSASDARYRALYDDNPSMYFTVDSAGTVLSVNAFGAQQLGYTPAELVGHSVLQVIHEDEREAATRYLGLCASSSEMIATSELRKVRRDGSILWVREVGRTLQSANGQPVLLIVCEDITDLKRAEERQNLLIAELDHRVKNVLAKVVAMVERTRENRDSVDDYRSALTGRVRSMANAHALLSRNRWRGVALNEIVEQELAPYAAGDKVTISGPEVMLTPEAGQTLTTVLHELATNAAKYGALSVADGRLDIGWSFASQANGPAQLVVRWTEHGGPPVISAPSTGFGTRVISSAVHHQLDGHVDLEFAAEGVRCTIEMPLSRTDQR